MLKIFGLIVFCVAVASCGFFYAERLKCKKKLFEQLTHFAKTAVNEMRGLNMNVFEIFSKNAVGELLFLSEIDTENLKDRNRIAKIAAQTKADSESVELITDFILNFGVSDLKGQISHCEYYSEKFFSKQKDAEAVFSEKGKLSITLSSLVASALFIILI